MKAFKALTNQLAHQVDRTLWHAHEEEDHFRLDIPAHEKMQLPKWKPIKKEKATSAPLFKMPSINVSAIALPQIPYQEIKRFGVAALLIYATLFSVTNAASYGKIAAANLSTAHEARVMANQPEALMPHYMETDPWGGERVSQHIPKAERLQAIQDSAATKQNQILPLGLMPTSLEDRIEIPSIDVNAPITIPEFGVDALTSQDWNVLEDSIRESLLEGVVHYPGTAVPGQKGNFFLTGHSSNVFWEASEFNTVFALLPRLNEGDDIYITYKQQEYHYQITSKKEVSPKDVSVLEQGDEHIMTLMTCTPVGTTLRRLVLTAELVD